MKVTKNGKEFFVNKYNTFWEGVDNNDWENGTFMAFDKFMDKKHSYIDIGAWIGPTALYGCQVARHCYAIEPDPVAFKSLQGNIGLNPNLKNSITLYGGCIGAVCGDVRLGTNSNFGDSLSSTIFGKPKKSVMVKSVTLDKFVKINNIEDCNFIKMDIEGGETGVLPSIKNYLKKNRPTLHLSLHPFLFRDIKKDSNAIIDALKIYEDISDNKKKLLDMLLEGRQFNIIATDKTVDWGGKLPDGILMMENEG